MSAEEWPESYPGIVPPSKTIVTCAARAPTFVSSSSISPSVFIPSLSEAAPVATGMVRNAGLVSLCILRRAYATLVGVESSKREGDGERTCYG